jgi:hypothetical protein
MTVARTRARTAQATAGRIASYDVKQSDPLLRLRRRPVALQQRGFVSPEIAAGRCPFTSCARSHLLPSRQQQFRPPDEGWMERRQAALILSVAPATRDPLSRGDRDLSRRSTVAVFGCGPTKPAPGSGTPEPQRLPAPRRNGLAVGVRTSLRCGSRRKRGTPLLAPSFRIVSGDAPHERGWHIIYTNPVT